MAIKNLYCIALIPGHELMEKVRILKGEMHQSFGAKHALKSPAHITLQMPFRREQAHESVIVSNLEEFAGDCSAFEVSLDGFGCFAPKVIFVKVGGHLPIIKLHSGLKTVLKDKIGLHEKEIMSNIFPHMTIATRDLTRQHFKNAWSEFESRSFIATFRVYSLHLLKHNGKNWDIYKEFKFNE
ncbi:MAG: 2'-5' RNA ligase family protein [Bacteroidetes bacterium]|nr:2'-5' RNA ligase family protein [Bacteroidota bacterium]